MKREDETRIRDTGRIVGPLLAGVGGIMFIVGFVQFASFEPSSFGPLPSMTMPFFGMILLGVGGAITKWAYVGPAAQYVANETAPAIGTAARSVVEEVRRVPALACHACGASNAGDAAFCKSCGGALRLTCASCGGANASDARFCDDCGKPIVP